MDRLPLKIFHWAFIAFCCDTPVSPRTCRRLEFTLRCRSRYSPLMVTPVQTQVQVTDSATLIDPYRTTAVEAIGSQALREECRRSPDTDCSILLIHCQAGF